MAGLMAAAGVLAGLSGFAVAGPVGVLVAARASPRRRLLAAVTPAYVASLRLRATRLEGQPAWQAADYTAHPHGHGYGAALRDRLQRLATADGRAIVLTAANRARAGTGSNDRNNPNQQPPKRSSSTSLAYCSRMPGRWPRTRRSSDGGHRWLRSAAYGAVGADSGWAGHAGHQWPAARRSSSGPTMKASATLNGRGSTTHYRISNDGLVEPGGWISACIQNRKARSRRSWQNSLKR